MSEEIWKDIPGYEGYYQISNRGRVKSLKRFVLNPNRWNKKNTTMMVDEKFLTPMLQANNRYQVGLSKNSKTKRFLLHRLLAKAFIPNPEHKPCINHKDGNPSNNSLNNLEWCTHSENTKHAYQTGLMPNNLNVGQKNGRSKLTTEEVLTIRKVFDLSDKKNNMIEEIFADLMDVFNVSERTIYRIIKRKTWKIESDKPKIIDYRKNY